MQRKGLQVESADDVAHAALRYRQGGIGFSDLMTAAAARRSGATCLYTFDRKVARLEDCALLGESAA
ncbi:MAG: PIN domain-containing protein [Gammaproteobacteria bacterium]|nr:PIN domain-containing protein [Gammaproteobacteria bacterium]